MPALLPAWEIAAPDAPNMVIYAANWLIALGEALQRQGRLEAISRLTCERLRDGTVLVQDISAGRRYAVRRAALPAAATWDAAYEDHVLSK